MENAPWHTHPKIAPNWDTETKKKHGNMDVAAKMAQTIPDSSDVVISGKTWCAKPSPRWSHIAGRASIEMWKPRTYNIVNQFATSLVVFRFCMSHCRLICLYFVCWKCQASIQLSIGGGDDPLVNGWLDTDMQFLFTLEGCHHTTVPSCCWQLQKWMTLMTLKTPFGGIKLSAWALEPS